MDGSKGSIAVVVSASAEEQATLMGAQLALQLTEAKVRSGQDIVSQKRYDEALRKVSIGMMALFHQGGAPSLFDGAVRNVGRIVAAGLVEGMAPLEGAARRPDPQLMTLTRQIFAGKYLHGMLWFSNVRLVPNPELTKRVIGRPPRAGENYIIVHPGDHGYKWLLTTWQNASRRQ